MISCQATSGITPVELAKAVLAGPCAFATDVTVADVLAVGFAHRLAGRFADAAPMLREGIEMLRSGEADADITRWALMGSNAAAELWDADGYRRMLDRHEQSERERGALDALLITLNGLANHEMWTGAFTAAEARYVEVTSTLEALGRDASTWRLAEVENLAWQGRVDETRTNAAVLTGDVVFAGVLSNLALLALTTLDLALGNYAEALASARQVYDADPVPHGNQVLPNLVEAGVRVGERDIAGAALARLSERATASQTRWALGLLARCEALMASDATAGPLYEHAIALLGDTDMAPDLARAHLLFGEWLRRQKRTIEAREHLRVAFDSFSTMGADAYAKRSRIELEATGERARKRTVETSFDLTPQENQIARLAAEGATNAEIAARFYLSRSTVDYHLRKVFQKLSITSRRQLARTLRALSPGRFSRCRSSHARSLARTFREELESGVSNLLPTGVDGERMGATGRRDVRGRGRTAALALVAGLGDRWGDGVVAFAHDDQQRSSVGVLGVDFGLGPWVEVGEGGLEERYP